MILTLAVLSQYTRVTDDSRRTERRQTTYYDNSRTLQWAFNVRLKIDQTRINENKAARFSVITKGCITLRLYFIRRTYRERVANLSQTKNVCAPTDAAAVFDWCTTCKCGRLVYQVEITFSTNSQVFDRIDKHNAKNVNFSRTRYRPLGPELIPVYRQSASRWLFKFAITFHQSCSHLPSRRTSPSFDQYQVILLGDWDTRCEQLAQGCYAALSR